MLSFTILSFSNPILFNINKNELTQTLIVSSEICRMQHGKALRPVLYKVIESSPEHCLNDSENKLGKKTNLLSGW